MTNSAAIQYDFEPFRERVFNKLREDFQEYIKRGLNVEPIPFCEEILRATGLPLNCPFREEVLTWLSHVYELKYLEKELTRVELQELILHDHSSYQFQGSSREDHSMNILSPEDYQLSLEVLALKNHQQWNFSSPFASFQVTLFGHQFRMTLCHHSLTPGKSSKAFIRSLKDNPFELKDFKLTEGQIHTFKSLIQNKKNLIVVGATGSGKTSFLRALLNHVPENEHIITLEDTYEIVNQRTYQTSLISAGEVGKSLKDYCSYALRMKPDRLILGEIRSEEVVPFLLAMNTGHSGLMASLHANSGVDALSRLCLLFQIYSPQKGLSYQEVLKLVCEGIDYVIFCQSKQVMEVIEVLGCEGQTPYYQRWEG